MLVAISLPGRLFPHEQRVLYRMLLDGTQLYPCEIGQTERWFCGWMETFYHQLCLRGCSWRKLAEGSQGPTGLMGQRKAEEPSSMQELRNMNRAQVSYSTFQKSPVHEKTHCHESTDITMLQFLLWLSLLLSLLTKNNQSWKNPRAQQHQGWQGTDKSSCFSPSLVKEWSPSLEGFRPLAEGGVTWFLADNENNSPSGC